MLPTGGVQLQYSWPVAGSRNMVTPCQRPPAKLYPLGPRKGVDADGVTGRPLAPSTGCPLAPTGGMGSMGGTGTGMV